MPEFSSLLCRSAILLMLWPLTGVSASDRASPAPAITHMRVLAASCAACHGTDGNSLGNMPALAGMSPDYFIAQMQAFRSGERKATVMHQHAKGLTPEEIEQLATFFSQQRRVPAVLPPSARIPGS